ncbi:MAG: ABC transporter ATP-binding protein [Rhizobiales bacterium]|nr:ABC transporter ATP-binding protein [Hyphomicrobiales bacterium]
MAELLEIENVSAGYGYGPDILNGISLEVRAGRSECVIGPNGAGKSTLLKAIAGLLPIRKGEIRLRGERIDRLRPDQIIRKGICFVTQERALFPKMTVRENLRMGGYILDDTALLERRIEAVLEQFPILKERARQHAGTLSGGEQQMLSMARAQIVEPDLIMLDEPSLGLAPRVVEQMYEVIRALGERGITVLLVEQNAVVGLGSADWGAVLDLGRTLFEGPADDILADPRIQELYLGSTGSTGRLDLGSEPSGDDAGHPAGGAR